MANNVNKKLKHSVKFIGLFSKKQFNYILQEGLTMGNTFEGFSKLKF